MRRARPTPRHKQFLHADWSRSLTLAAQKGTRMRKMIFMAVATYVWNRYKSRRPSASARPRP
jgi:hypothetical protein